MVQYDINDREEFLLLSHSRHHVLQLLKLLSFTRLLWHFVGIEVIGDVSLIGERIVRE